MPIKVEIFSSTGCSKCTQAKHQLIKLTTEFGPQAIDIVEVDVLENIDYAVSLGVLSTPAIAIDGNLCFTGLPSAKKLRDYLEQLLNKRQDQFATKNPQADKR